MSAKDDKKPKLPEREFDVLASYKIHGGYEVGANTLMMRKPGSSQMRYLDADDDGTTRNSSEIMIKECKSKKIIFAGLFWGGRYALHQKERLQRARFKGPEEAYVLIRADILDTNEADRTYSAYADVTEAVRLKGAGSYWLADVAAQEGADNFAAWSMVVMYEDGRTEWNHLTLYHGYNVIRGKTLSIFNLKQLPSVHFDKADMAIFAYEGDREISGDYMELGGEILHDGGRIDPVNFFDSASIAGEGLDLKVLDVSRYLGRGMDEVTVTAASRQDHFQLVYFLINQSEKEPEPPRTEIISSPVVEPEPMRVDGKKEAVYEKTSRSFFVGADFGWMSMVYNGRAEQTATGFFNRIFAGGFYGNYTASLGYSILEKQNGTLDLLYTDVVYGLGETMGFDMAAGGVLGRANFDIEEYGESGTCYGIVAQLRRSLFLPEIFLRLDFRYLNYGMESLSDSKEFTAGVYWTF